MEDINYVKQNPLPLLLMLKPTKEHTITISLSDGQDAAGHCGTGLGPGEVCEALASNTKLK